MPFNTETVIGCREGKHPVLVRYAGHHEMYAVTQMRCNMQSTEDEWHSKHYIQRYIHTYIRAHIFPYTRTYICTDYGCWPGKTSSALALHDIYRLQHPICRYILQGCLVGYVSGLVVHLVVTQSNRSQGCRIEPGRVHCEREMGVFFGLLGQGHPRSYKTYYLPLQVIDAMATDLNFTNLP